MIFSQPLIEATLIKRYKRFLADVKLPSGEIVLVHVPNSGSMKGVSDPGSACRISKSASLTRKIPYTLEMVKTFEGQWVGVNTALTNSLVHEAFTLRKIKDWHSFSDVKREVKINKESRLDFLLSSPSEKLYVEVKNVSMAQPPWAVFPDAKTERGQKHLQELATLATKGLKTEIFFVVQREDCKTFRPCDEIDPVYGELLRKVVKQKVLARCWSCKLTPQSIELDKPLDINLD
jgi:sugar fermentation stimulation protein A